MSQLLEAACLGITQGNSSILQWEWNNSTPVGHGYHTSKRLLIWLVTGNDGKPSMFGCRRDDRDVHIDKTKTCGLSADELAACLEELYLV